MTVFATNSSSALLTSELAAMASAVLYEEYNTACKVQDQEQTTTIGWQGSVLEMHLSLSKYF